VADSPALLAQQMRLVIREQLQAGKSDEEIVQYFASRYGEQNVVWSPPRQGFALLAWIVPIALLLGGIVLLFFVFRDWLASSVLAHPPSPARHDHKDEHADEAISGAAVLEDYRAQIEHELAADDVLFRRYKTEAK
jgi:cytochrome c-type biogenesis protein CcmH